MAKKPAKTPAPPPCELCPVGARQFNPACLTCGGRYLRAIQRHPMRSKEWLQRTLDLWVAHGHSEQKLRVMSGASSRSAPTTASTPASTGASGPGE